MKIIQICPKCSVPGVEVPFKVIESMAFNKRELWDEKEKSYACVNGGCDTAYFQKSNSIRTNDIRVKLWFKDGADNVPICYCSGLTRREIKDAVQNGCKTIDEVQKYTGKNITGKCETENPLGNCCREVFKYAIVASELNADC